MPKNQIGLGDKHEQTSLSNCHLYCCSTHDVRICLRGRSNTRTGLQTRANNVAGARLQLDRSLRWRERRRAWGSQDPLNLITNRFDHLSTSISGGLFGGTIGAQVQVSYVVLGLEADLDWANIKGSTSVIPTVGGIPVTAFPINAETKIDWESTARLRAGFAANNVMAYITGGIAVLGAKTTLTTPVGPVCGGIFSGCSGTDRQIGAALGAGIEYGFTPNLSAKLEYLYITAASLEISHTNVIRAGLNYRFSGF